MAKKGRNRKFGTKKEVEIERGYTVVFTSGTNVGKRVYLSSHPKGMPLADAEEMSKRLLSDSEVVPIDQVG